MSLMMLAMPLFLASDNADAGRCTATRRIDFATPYTLQLQPSEQQAQPLWIEEIGFQVTVQQGDAQQDISAGPVRYGVLPLTIGPGQQVVLSSRSNKASVLIATGCAAFGGAASMSWWTRVSDVVDHMDSRATVPAVDPLQALVDSASTVFQKTMALHVRAYWLSTMRQNLAGIDAYLAVAQLWQLAGDNSRAGAALLGAAESAHNASRYEQSADFARRAGELLAKPTDQVFHDRALEAECLAQQALKQADVALRCLDGVRVAFRRSDNVEGLVSVLYGIASAQYARGDVNASIAAEEEALALDPRRTQPSVRGRIVLQMARRQVDSGQITAAIESYARAIEMFATSPESKVWENEALSKLARLYAKLGMADTAYRSVERLLKESAASDDPAQVASLLLTLSHVEESGERPQAALRWARVSAGLFSKLRRQDGAQEGQLREAELRLRHDLEASQPMTSLDGLDSTKLSMVDRGRLTLVKAMQAAQAGDAQRSSQLATSIDPATLDSAQRNLRTAVQARAALAQDTPAAAMATVVEGITDSVARAADAGNSGVGWIAMRSAASLRPLLVDTWLSMDPAQRSTSALWQEWLLTLPASAIRGRAAVTTEFAASSAVSREFLHGVQGSRSDADLLKSIGKAGHAPSAAPAQVAMPPTLSALQASLAPGDLLLALASGRNHSLLLRISHDQTQVEPLPSRQVLLAAALSFNALVQRRSSTASELDTARLQLQELLFQNVAGPRPRRLLLLLDDVLANIPFSALYWPGDEQPLIAFMPVTWVSDVRSSQRPAMPRTRNIQQLKVLVASRLQTRNDALPELAGAQLEPDMIRTAMPAAELSILKDGQADRRQLLQALDGADNWLHLASHGWTEPGLFGHAGVWLAGPQPSDEPQFLSWLDVADQPIAADLVVLNACQLAATDINAVSQGSMSFALAVSAAGARNTVAAFWPVSDAATALWVPEFYSYMDGRDADASGEALRRAQLVLLNSRAYRHPYYWASLGHFRRLDVNPTQP